MEISPASLAQVRRAQDGGFVQIDNDVANVAEDLQAIDPSLRLRFSEAGGYFVVYEVRELPDGSTEENLVLTSQDLDQRIVERVRQIAEPGYDYTAELEAQDQAARDAADARLHEHVGEVGERLYHAMRKDTGAL